MALSEFQSHMNGLLDAGAVKLSEIPVALHPDLRLFLSGKTWTEVDGEPAIWQGDFHGYWERVRLFGFSYVVYFKSEK